jgi:hypothetical protein
VIKYSAEHATGIQIIMDSVAAVQAAAMDKAIALM